MQWQTAVIGKLQSSKDLVIAGPRVDVLNKTYGEGAVSLDYQYICTCEMLNTNYVLSEGSPITVICEMPVKHPQLVKKRIVISIQSWKEGRSRGTLSCNLFFFIVY